VTALDSGFFYGENKMAKIVSIDVKPPKHPAKQSGKAIKAWRKECADLDDFVARINALSAACDDKTDAMVKELLSLAELSSLNLPGSFNFHVNRLMQHYNLPNNALLFINMLMSNKHINLKKTHIAVSDDKRADFVAGQLKEFEAVLDKLPQWRLEDGWWIKRNISSDNKTVFVTKIKNGLDDVADKFIKVSATFNHKTNSQIDAGQVETAVNIMDLL
jgi:hypothetical protein